jgi:hypothetical protein
VGKRFNLNTASAEEIADVLIKVDSSKAATVAAHVLRKLGPSAWERVKAAFEESDERPGPVIGRMLGAFLGSDKG